MTAAPAVRLAGATDVDAVAEVLAAAYDGDPWVGWVVDADRHRERIRALQAGLLGLVGVPHGEVELAEEATGAVLGGAMWLLAERPVPASAWARVAAHEEELMGGRHAAALAAGAATGHLRPRSPHHLLATLGVLPWARGRGIGSALLAPVLGRAERDGPPAYLETSSEENLAFYARLGFAVTGHVRLPDGGPPVWGLLRSPA